MPDRLTPGDGQDVFASIKRAWERGDPDAILDRFAEDAEYRTDPFEPALAGANAIRAHWNAVAARQARVEFDAERVWVSGSTVLGSWHAAVTVRETGERVRVRGFSTVELDDEGRISRMRDWAIAREVGTDSGFTPEGSEVQGG